MATDSARQSGMSAATNGAGTALQGCVEGIVVSRSSGFYLVQLTDGQSRLCQLRGRLRDEEAVLVGDRVYVRPTEEGRGVIEQVLPRKSSLRRPAVANVTLAVAVMALVEPPPDLHLLDRLLVAIGAAGLKAVVCWNKSDLADPQTAGQLRELYRQAGYDVVVTSAVHGVGVQELAERLRDEVATLCGPSGVGKSALINALCPGAGQATGELSRKLGRGRHTTRTVRLLALPGGGLLADTPGFSRLDLDGVAPRQLGRLMPDIERWSHRCRFGSRCLHMAEPECAVREAARQGQIASSRYQNYLRLLQELQELEARRYA